MLVRNTMQAAGLHVHTNAYGHCAVCYLQVACRRRAVPAKRGRPFVADVINVCTGSTRVVVHLGVGNGTFKDGMALDNGALFARRRMLSASTADPQVTICCRTPKAGAPTWLSLTSSQRMQSIW